MTAILSCQGLSYQFKGQAVLKNIHFTVKKGTIFGLLGPSGAGKSTLINSLTGQIIPNQGQIWSLNKKPQQLLAEDLMTPWHHDRRAGLLRQDVPLQESPLLCSFSRC